jgi:hypothetical protein
VKKGLGKIEFSTHESPFYSPSPVKMSAKQNLEQMLHFTVANPESNDLVEQHQETLNRRKQARRNRMTAI